VYTATEIVADGSYFILYLPQPQFTSYAIILEIQANVTDISMRRSIEKCLHVYDRFGIEPYLVLLCTDTVSLSVKSLLSPTLQNPYWLTLGFTIWAKECLIISKDAIDFNNSKTDQHLDPLVVLATYFSDDEEQKHKLKNIDDPTIQLLQVID
jgi:hypothetical protein